MTNHSIKVKIIKIQFQNNSINSFDIPKFRGSIARQFPKYYLIHNHMNDGKYRYGYPLIQFKVIDKIPTIIGIADGIDILKIVFMDIDRININGRNRKIWEKSVQIEEEPFGQSSDFFEYTFLSPWMALKEENYAIYKQLDFAEQQIFLRHILRENLKTVSKGFKYRIPDIESVKIEGYFKPRTMNFKNVKMLCFTGEFAVNFNIPNFLGVGKQVARGYGMVKRRK